MGVIDNPPIEAVQPTALMTIGAATRPINSTAFQPSATQDAMVSYCVEIACTLSLSGGQTGTIFLEVSPDGASNWVEIGHVSNGNTGTLTIGLNITQTLAGCIAGMIPAGYYGRLRQTGTAASYTYKSGQETLV